MKWLTFFLTTLLLITTNIFGQGFTLEQRTPGDYFSSCKVNDTTVVSFGKNVMAVYNFSNPDTPKMMSLTETDMSVCWTIGSINNYLFLINQARIKVYDINDPFNPSFLYKNDTIPISNATIKDTLLIVQQSSNKIIIYDFSDINNPFTVSEITVPSTPSDIAASDSLLFISHGGDENISVYDISNPASPQLISTFGFLPYVSRIVAEDSLLFAVMNHYEGYQVYNVKQPENPELIGEAIDPDYVTYLTYYELEILGHHLLMRTNGGRHVLNLTGGTYIADFSNPQSPSLPNYQYLFGTNNLCVYDNKLIASNVLGLSVYDIVYSGYVKPTGTSYNTSPMVTPKLYGNQLYFNLNGLGVVNLANDSTGVTYQNSFGRYFDKDKPTIYQDSLYIAVTTADWYHDSLLVFKGGDLTSLSLIGKCQVSEYGFSEDVVLYNGILYGYNFHSYYYTTLNIYDLRDPANPEYHASIRDTMITREFIRFLNLIYFIGDEINIYDISTGLNPYKIYEEYTEDSLPKLDNPVFHAGYLYCSYQDGFAAWDISNPIEPLLVLKKKISPNFYPRDLVIYNDKIIVPNRDEIKTYDITNPEDPILIDTSPTNFSYNSSFDDAFYYGGSLFLTTKFFGMYVYKDNGVVSVDEGQQNQNDFPTEYVLSQNYPNPFNPATTIRFSLPEYSDVNLSVFNALGEKVAELLNGAMEAGNHEVRFDASQLPSGIYFYRLQSGSFSETKKMLLLR